MLVKLLNKNTVIMCFTHMGIRILTLGTKTKHKVPVVQKRMKMEMIRYMASCSSLKI